MRGVTAETMAFLTLVPLPGRTALAVKRVRPVPEGGDEGVIARFELAPDD